MTDAGWRWTAAGACLTLVSLPFLAVDFIPCTDLPQHLGQLRLFAEAWGDPGGALTIQWWTPYGLVYALMAIPWLLLPPIAAGRVGVWLIVVAMVGLIHLAAARWQRPISAAVLATAFTFNTLLYWGFLNFLFGFIAFSFWFALTRRESPEGLAPGLRGAGLFFLGAAVLYFSHALWFAFGLLWLAVEALITRRSWRQLLWRGLGIAPVVLGAAWWFIVLRDTQFVSDPLWQTSFLERLHPLRFRLAALGGLAHGVELMLVAVAVAWIVAALVANRKRDKLACDPYFATLGLMFLALYLFMPTKYASTILFNMRWLPFALISLLVAVGPLGLRVRLRQVLALVLLASSMAVTAASWQAFEKIELEGFAESLSAIEDDSRVMGLAYLGRSSTIAIQPFIQLFSWAYVVHGGSLSFSFGDFPTSLVVYKDTRRRVWTQGLEWIPKRVRRSDFQHFDYALVGGDDVAHQRMTRVEELEPVAGEGVWRLYRVERRQGGRG